MHDLSAGGSFDFVAKGTFHTANADSNVIEDAIQFTSNVLTTSVNSAKASKVRRDFHEHAKRQIVQSDCTGSKLSATDNALSNCLAVANGARTAATSGSATKVSLPPFVSLISFPPPKKHLLKLTIPSQFSEYFKTTSSSTRSAVASVYQRIAGECDSSTSGVSREYCTDVYGACSSNVLAYTLPSQSYMVNCPIYFSALPGLTRTCHAQDQATTTLHETTHLTQIQGTQDLGYGYAAVTRLSAAQATQNADTFALYANAIYAGC